MSNISIGGKARKQKVPATLEWSCIFVSLFIPKQSILTSKLAEVSGNQPLQYKHIQDTWGAPGGVKVKGRGETTLGSRGWGCGHHGGWGLSILSKFLICSFAGFAPPPPCRHPRKQKWPERWQGDHNFAPNPLPPPPPIAAITFTVAHHKVFFKGEWSVAERTTFMEYLCNKTS